MKVDSWQEREDNEQPYRSRKRLIQQSLWQVTGYTADWRGKIQKLGDQLRGCGNSPAERRWALGFLCDLSGEQLEKLLRRYIITPL